MRIPLALAFALLLTAAGPQDVPGLIEKLKSKDTDEAENAQKDILKAGPAALPTVRAAEAKADDPAIKKLLGTIGSRLETRQAVAALSKTWGDRWYSVIIESVHVGWVHLKTTEKDGKLVFEDEFSFKFDKNNAATTKTTLTCLPDEFLTLSEIAIQTESPERNFAATGRVKDGRLVVKKDDKTTAAKLDARTVADAAFLRLVTALPRSGSYEITLLRMIADKPKFRENTVVKFDKEESIDLDGRKIKARRYILSDGELDQFYYVDAENRLVRLQFQSDDKGVDLSLTDQKRAQDIDTKD